MGLLGRSTNFSAKWAREGSGGAFSCLPLWSCRLVSPANRSTSVGTVMGGACTNWWNWEGYGLGSPGGSSWMATSSGTTVFGSPLSWCQSWRGGGTVTCTGIDSHKVFKQGIGFPLHQTYSYVGPTQLPLQLEHWWVQTPKAELEAGALEHWNLAVNSEHTQPRIGWISLSAWPLLWGCQNDIDPHMREKSSPNLRGQPGTMVRDDIFQKAEKTRNLSY